MRGRGPLALFFSLPRVRWSSGLPAPERDTSCSQESPLLYLCPLLRNCFLSVPQLLTLILMQSEQQWTAINLVLPERSWLRAVSHPQGSAREGSASPASPGGSVFRPHILPLPGEERQYGERTVRGKSAGFAARWILMP